MEKIFLSANSTGPAKVLMELAEQKTFPRIFAMTVTCIGGNVELKTSSKDIWLRLGSWPEKARMALAELILSYHKKGKSELLLASGDGDRGLYITTAKNCPRQLSAHLSMAA